MRGMVSENSVEARHLVLPAFVADGIDEPRPISSMPGVVQHTMDGLRRTAVECAEWVANQAVQLFGGLGFMSESEVSRQYRDVRLLGIGGGTTEILTTLAGRRLGFTA